MWRHLSVRNAFRLRVVTRLGGITGCSSILALSSLASKKGIKAQTVEIHEEVEGGSVMLALGIDPGTAICGYGVVRLEGSTLKAVAYGAIETRAGQPVEMRLNSVFQGIDQVMKQYKPNIVGVEKLFFNRNVTTAMTVSQARGVILLAAAQNAIQLAEFTPLQVKQSVAGYGKATKEQIIYMTEKLLRLPAKPHPDDVADALAVAICSLHTHTFNKVWECKR